MRLVTIEQVFEHVAMPVPGSPVTPDEQDVLNKVEVAEALVLDYVDQRLSGTTAWSAEVASWDINGSPGVLPPPAVQQAVLVQTLDLRRFRGDDTDQPKRDPATLHPTVVALLHRFRDPALA